MADATTVYTIMTSVHVNQWNQQLQRAESGWEVEALWAATNTVIPVFLPDAQYTPENVDKAIRDAGAVVSQVHALGK